MFHAEFLIDDRDVVKLHYALATLRVFNVDIKPASNVKANNRNGKVEEVIPGGGILADRLKLVLTERYEVGAQIPRSEIFEIVRQIGNSPNSNVITALLKAKVVRKKGRGIFVRL